MSIEPIVVNNFKQTGDHLTALNERIAQTEEVTAIAHKVWKWLKIGFPILVGAIVSASGEGSPIGKFASYVLHAMQGLPQ